MPHPAAEQLDRAAALIREADALLITAGAGMGVDSGLPDFRGEQGFWQAYPALGQRQLRFAEVASPDTFRSEPRLAWGFYGHRLQLYRTTRPHAGFKLLQRWAARLPQGGFVFTSNVDGQFQHSGWDAAHIAECHGSIHHLQCLDSCTGKLWPADTLTVTVDESRCEWLGELPQCPHCGGLARPNILMFGDWDWIDDRTLGQQSRLRNWLGNTSRRVVIELGAGTAIPTVRWFGQQAQAPMIRINCRESAVSHSRDIGLALGALEALSEIDARL